MELIINGTTYVLREMNCERRRFFAEQVLIHYNYEAEDFNAFIEQVRIELKEKHNIDKTTQQVVRDFFKEFAKKINLSIWTFLKDEDKRILKNSQNLDLDKDQIQMFLEANCAKIRAYSDYIKSSSGGGKSEDINTIFAYLSKSYGWTFADIKEMDELELINAIEQASILSKRDSLDRVNSQALAGAYVSGSKQAKSAIDKLNNSLKHEVNMKKLQKTNPKFEMKNGLSDEELQKLMDRK